MRSVKRLFEPIVEFIRSQSSGALVLLACTVVALVWANSPWSESYASLWRGMVLHVVNDGLMAVFFLLVGLEIKREVLAGELSSRKLAALPIAAAVGGMIAPALVYLAFNAGSSTARGWGIPMATDIAFSLGVLAMLGPRVPLSLKVFLTALAIVDDIGTVIVIAAFYSDGIRLETLLVCAIVLAALFALNGLRVKAIVPYILLGALLWVLMGMSGIHPTIAGVATAFAIPASGDESPLHRLESILQRPVSYFVMPLFALANAGVSVAGLGMAELTSPVAVGVFAGLLLGKSVGITAFAWLGTKFRLAQLPDGVTWTQVAAIAFLGGIGFTMSLFVSGLAFEGADHEVSKLGILLGSAVSAVIGAILISKSRGSQDDPVESK